MSLPDQTAMVDYQPLDTSELCNVGIGFHTGSRVPMLGTQRFRGLPFLIGGGDPDPQRCFIGFDTTNRPSALSIPVASTASWILFAHALLQSDLFEGGAMGQVVASYVVNFADGELLRVPIRERFEVGSVPTEWGQFPFLAVPDQPDALLPREGGQWTGAGRRQTEAFHGLPGAYYLWAWPNPRPESEIASIGIEPGHHKYLLAAITLSHIAESPFVRTAKQEVKITLPAPEDAEKPFSLSVEVDRGMATYPYPLPKDPADVFLADSFKGWGEALNTASSPAYVEVAAVPSATVTVKQGDATLGSANWGDLIASGKADLPRLHLEVVDRGRNWVHITVVDDETNQPIPCRVHFRSPEGIPYQPHGHHSHVNSDHESWHIDVGGDVRLEQVSYAYIDGHCQGWLPRGDVIADVARGFEYEPLRTTITIDPGQRDLTLRLRRWTNMNAQHWYSGDTHVHFLATQGAHLEAQGEDLNVVNLLQSQWGHLFTNTEDFIGRPTLSNGGKTIVYCSQENRQHILGHLSLLGLKTPVYPWCTSGPQEAELGGSLEETLSAWADAAHAQGGTVIIPHLPTPNGEPAALIATGRADALEMLEFGGYRHLEYYRYLNCGYRLPLVGGTDKMSSEVPVGLCRTYAYLPDEEFTYDNWCKAVRAGRTFLSSGPIITLTIDGKAIGDTVQLPRGGGTVEIEATAESAFPLHTLQIVQQGKVVAEAHDDHGTRRFTLKATVKVDHHTWFAARCGGPNYVAIPHHDSLHRGCFAHTSPIYVAVEDEWWLFDKDVAQYMLTLIDGSMSFIRERALQYPLGTVTHHHGEGDHLAHLERPFNEAIAAIHKRLHDLEHR